jgi:hypothetical protein
VEYPHTRCECGRINGGKRELKRGSVRERQGGRGREEGEGEGEGGVRDDMCWATPKAEMQAGSAAAAALPTADGVGLCIVSFCRLYYVTVGFRSKKCVLCSPTRVAKVSMAASTVELAR